MLLRSHTCASCAHAHAAMLPRASPLTRVCPRALCLVWSAGHSCWTRTSSPPSQRRSSTDSRTLSKERGRETRHARQHASLGERHVTHASTRLCPLCVSLGAHTCALCANAQPLCCHAHPLTRVCPRALYLVWSAGNLAWATTSSPPSQCWSSTDSRTFGKERGRETRHARQHASLPSLHAAGGTYLRLVRARAGRYTVTRIPTDARVTPRPLSCVVRRRLQLAENQLASLPVLVFNGLTNLW